MPQLTLKDAEKFLDKPAFYVIHTGMLIARFPVIIRDARASYGRVDFCFVPIGGSVEFNGQSGDGMWATEVDLTSTQNSRGIEFQKEDQ